MLKNWCKKQNKICDYFDSTQKCNYEVREGVSYLDCNSLISKYPYNITISCSELDYKEIGYSWCCDLGKYSRKECDEGCEQCFKEHGVVFNKK